MAGRFRCEIRIRAHSVVWNEPRYSNPNSLRFEGRFSRHRWDKRRESTVSASLASPWSRSRRHDFVMQLARDLLAITSSNLWIRKRALGTDFALEKKVKKMRH